MKRALSLSILALTLATMLCPAALAAEPVGAGASAQVCYPTSITRSEDGTELKKIYDLGPEDDPAGIPRSDFEQDGFHYTLTDLLKQELPENESRQHTETVSLPSKNKDMESVLALLPTEKEFITDDGLSGTLSLDLSTVRVEVAGYGSSTKEVSATRTYPNLANQDTQYIPKSIQEDGRTLTLQTINWQTDNTASMDGYALGDRFTAVATYTGTATSSYVKGYTVTADYTGTVSRIALNKVRYVAIFEGTPLEPSLLAETEDSAPAQFNWLPIAVPFGVVALAGVGIGAALFIPWPSPSQTWKPCGQTSRRPQGSSLRRSTAAMPTAFTTWCATAPPPEQRTGSQERRCPSSGRMGSALLSAPAGRAVSLPSSGTARIPSPARPGATLELTLPFPPARLSVRLCPAWSPPLPTTPAATATM